jgi:metal-dependent HD superfamily phosphatase/phosphodiesterase
VLTLDILLKDEEVLSYIKAADKHLEALGYTEHGLRHATYVGKRAGEILRKLKYDERTCKIAEFAGLLHDIGNAINRDKHALTGAILAYNLLLKKGFPLSDALEVAMAIGNHHEEEGGPVSPACAALIIADKSDVHRERVRERKDIRNDIHDRVNYSAKSSKVIVYPKKKKITFDIEIDTKISPVFEYFEIFMERMLIASKAAKYLGLKFELIINGTKML